MASGVSEAGDVEWAGTAEQPIPIENPDTGAVSMEYAYPRDPRTGKTFDPYALSSGAQPDPVAKYIYIWAKSRGYQAPLDVINDLVTKNPNEPAKIIQSIMNAQGGTQ